MAKKRTPSTSDSAPSIGTETIRVEKDLAEMLTIISIRRKCSVASLVSPKLRAWVEQVYREVVAEMSGELQD